MIASPRRAARVLLVDASGRILLLCGTDPSQADVRYWFTPGGGLEDGETPAAAAARELAEETGLRLAPDDMGPSVWHETVEFRFDGGWHCQSQDFFLVRVADWEMDDTGFNDFERRVITGHRWWLPEELTITADQYFPECLPELLFRLLEGEPAC